jgi:hypothetical protein
MQMEAVVSDNVRAVGYDASRSIMRVAFHSGGVYDYYDVSADLHRQMLLPHPWRRVGNIVKSHRWNKVQ